MAGNAYMGFVTIIDKISAAVAAPVVSFAPRMSVFHPIVGAVMIALVAIV